MERRTATPSSAVEVLEARDDKPITRLRTTMARQTTLRQVVCSLVEASSCLCCGAGAAGTGPGGADALRA
jgi:hypothetical protein